MSALSRTFMGGPSSGGFASGAVVDSSDATPASLGCDEAGGSGEGQPEFGAALESALDATISPVRPASRLSAASSEAAVAVWDPVVWACVVEGPAWGMPLPSAVTQAVAEKRARRRVGACRWTRM